MDEYISTMPASEYVKKIAGLIEPIYRVEYLQDQIEKTKVNGEKKKRTERTNSIIISFFVGLLFMMLFCVVNIVQLVYMFGSTSAWIFLSFIVPTIIFGIYFMRRANAKIAQTEAETQNTVEVLNKEKNQIVGTILLPLSQYVPQDYWYYNAIQHIYTYLVNGRARNRLEAINLYEEEMHRMRMEDMQADIMRSNRMQETYAAITAAASVTTAMNTSSINSKLENW